MAHQHQQHSLSGSAARDINIDQHEHHGGVCKAAKVSSLDRSGSLQPVLHQYLCQQQQSKQHFEKEQETVVSLPNHTQQIKQMLDTSIQTFAAALHFNSSTNEPFLLWK